MNERIRLLALQAGNYAYKMNPEEDSYGRPANPRKFQQDRDEKFAELLIQECFRVCNQQTPNWKGEYATAFGDGVEFCISGIKEHFGVDESTDPPAAQNTLTSD